MVPNDKSVVLIDGGYLSTLTKKYFSNSGIPLRLDFSKLGQILASKSNSDLIRTYYYDCPPYVSPKPSEDEKRRQESFDKFHHNLKKLDKFQVRLGTLKKYDGQNGNIEFEQKGVDVLLAIDALKLSLKGKISKVILITGDSDFVPVIQSIKDEGVEVILYYHESSVHRHLLENCDDKRLIIKELLETCKL